MRRAFPERLENLDCDCSCSVVSSGFGHVSKRWRYSGFTGFEIKIHFKGLKQRNGAAMADIHVPLCSIVAFDPSSICYRVCGSCEQVLPAETSDHDQNIHPCVRCRRRPRNPASPITKHLYKLLMSIVTDHCAIVVVVFDRAARILFGCSADDFLRFLSHNVSAVEMASKVLEGEMLSLVLRPSKGGYGQHLRAVSIVPLSSSFQPVMAILPQLYASGRF